MKPAESTAPEEFGPYIVYERLGVGGMATVHRAKKRGIAGFERGVALKRILPHLADDAEFINSFVREAKLASLLVHPNIAQIYDFGRVGSVYYIAMEHVDGFDVRKMLRHANRHKEPLPLAVVMSVLCELCEALEYAHTFVDEHGEPQGIVHRDVSPSNLIVAHSGHLKVIDFGIAKATARPLHTESGRVKGKLGYMSPEAVAGRTFGPVSDVFSAGVVAHELLTAQPLFSAKTDYDTLIRIHEAEIPPPSRKNPSIPAALDELVLAALARDPEHRLPGAGAFRDGIEYIAAQAGVRFSARDVVEWRARIATAEDPWGSRTSLPIGSSSGPGAGSAGTPSAGASGGPSTGPSTGSPAGSPSSPVFHDSRTGMAHERTLLADAGPSRPASAEPRFGRGSASVNEGTLDEDRLLADLTWGSDAGGSPFPRQTARSGPATSAQRPSQPPDPAAEPQVAPVAGASIRPPRRGALARLALAALFAIAAGLAGYQFVLRSKKPLPPPPPPVASLKFVVQPADAIVEIGGKEVGHGSPFEVQLDPGVLSVAVRRPGYKPWATQIALRDGEKQTVRVALEIGVARLSVASQPPGLAVQLDGKPLDQVTPLEIQVAPGAHQLVVTGAAGLAWSQDFTAEVDGKYSFSAPLAAPARPGASATVAAAGRTAPAPTQPPPPERSERADRNERGDRDRSDRSDRNDRPRRGAIEKASRPSARDAVTDSEVRIIDPEPEPPGPPSPRIDAGVPPVVAPESPRPPIAPTPAKTPVVAATAVTKLSGEIPTMKSSGISDGFADVISKMCIDDRGHVTSVKLVKAIPEIAEELSRTLLGWRYRPYVNSAGQPSAVCFPLSFRVVFKRAG
ncbi:MAG TPA: protein kinase [Kofleriaceae bacterium]|nr:protein kinase [Kofleriaceae bacterium]